MKPANDPSETARSQLGLWDTISIIIGIVIGTSIFYVPGVIFANVATPWTGLIVWAAGGVLALVGALCYAELATTYPRSGGDYVYLTRAFGPWAGFLFGWAQLSLVLTASIGAMAYVFAEYTMSLGLPNLAPTLGVEAPPEFVYAALAVLVLSLLNLLGVTFGKLTQKVLTVIKVLGLAGILIAGFGWAEPGRWEAAAAPTGSPWSFGALAVILVLYAYGGWSDAAFVAAEVRDPRRNIPGALVFGTALITLLYLLVNAAYLLSLGFDEVRKLGPNVPPVPVRVLARTPLGQHGADAISVLIMISALGAANGLIFTGARVYATLGRDHRLFGWVGYWQPGRGAPAVAILLQAAITIGLLVALGTPEGNRATNEALAWLDISAAEDWKASGAFETLISHTAPVFWSFFLLTGLSVFVLREKDRDLPRPFMVPLYPVVPLIFCSMCLYMLYRSIRYVEERALLAFAILWLGVLLYLVSRLLGSPRGEDTFTAGQRGKDASLLK
jgi:amino acid transporter